MQLLQGKGYTVLEKNWRHRHLEIDIIARHGQQLVIVEVKTRASADFGNPEGFVDVKKQQLLIRATHAYIEEKDIDLETRFDIISVLDSGGEPQLSHIEGAFYPILR